MQCPACPGTLVEHAIGGLVVDACLGGCGGLWFDRFELQKVDEASEAAGGALLDLPRDPAVLVDHTRRRTCPRCTNQIMMRHAFSPRREAEVDTCPSCAGLWLDPGELAAIRAAFPTQEARDTATRAYFSDLFGDAPERARHKPVASMFRFLLPGDYFSP